ncbi:hypothetical protein GOBAR_AA36761 [Gossypium barbadense]|uniref:Uncharacterized protein n=1 Tax=Gossypium barbadense TaxID=3634 RepID=A0A2P5VYP3_GOSBA|nr:hypothetical protein GOBAR_AA36761 [Gossypium barbadense]
MLSKFILVLKTRFPNIETALKNQQASIQGLETQIGQLSKLISERPQGSFPSNTEPNPREQLNAINIQNDEGVVEPEPELREETVVSKGKDEVDQNTNKPVNEEYKPRVPYPNATRKDRPDEQFGDGAVTLQARNSVKTSKTQDNAIKPVDDKTNTQSSLQEPLRTKTTETVHYYHLENKDTHKERRLRIEELDEWQAHKSRTHDKPKLRQNEFDTSPNQLKVGDKVLLEAVDPHIVTTTPNEEIPLTVLSIFPFGMMSFSAHTARQTGVPKAVAKQGKRHGRVEAGLDFPKTWDAINPHGRATWPWVNLIGEHGRARGKALLFLRHGRGTLTHGRGRREPSHIQPCNIIMQPDDLYTQVCDKAV